MIKAVLFDLDGTFADTASDLAAALNHTRATRHLPPLPLEVLRPQASHGSRGLLKVGFGIEPGHSDYDTLRDIFLDYYASNICVHTKLFGDTAQLVAALEQHGIKWGIVTNKPHRFTVPLMQALGYAGRASCLVSGDTCAHAKPHAEPMLKACEIIGASPAQCLYIGDDLRDMQAANAAGMRGIIANYGYVSADASVENWCAHGSVNQPTELLAFISQ
ncbi:MAG: Phosphoglycolate phosphatase [Candidatus Gallionella acididurans]|uniref:Phosphoglycolate phosphatase n=1 Tax=Candidatus Gallionella acididurans TaxID=1796491 RepID=A0A139BWV3_9PROT|nr:MAG: Phosphoglycolate phosphatase [Candidatus Gallionella acididurans]